MQAKNFAIITGTSRGLGKALAISLLNDGYKVWGLSRSSTIIHKDYEHIKMDLSNITAISKIALPKIPSPGKIILINNAGSLGLVKYIGMNDDEILANTIDVNLTAPILLTNKFLKTYSDLKAEKIIINISSGAANNPVDGWGAYCSTKAGLDMFSKVTQLEQEILNSGVRIFSIAPGIIDTAMQEQIRKTDEANFIRRKTFIGYYENKELKPPGEIAKKIKSVIETPEKFTGVILSVREF